MEPQVSDVSPRELHNVLSYDSETGAFTWKERPLEMFLKEHQGRIWNTRYANKPAFARFDREGYHKGGVLGRTFQAHRVAWALHYGEWPCGQIDHINGIKTDNRITNLRVVDHVENGRNRKRSKANKSGVTGISFARRARKWIASITVQRRVINLGSFEQFDAAVKARALAERAYGFHANHGRG